MNRGWTGGEPESGRAGGAGRRQGRQPYITFGYHRRPPARTRARGRRPDLSAYARQPARGPTMLAHRVAICWPMLAYLAGNEGPSCGYVGLCLPHVGPCWAKRSEKWEQQKNAVKRRIFWWSAAYLGAMLAHPGAMLAHLGAMLAHLGGYVAPAWGYVGPSWSYVGPSWGLCWPILGLCWPILRPMLAHPEAFVGPSWPILNHKTRKIGKNAKSTKHRKTR